ncbi:MAG TPA: GNAT family N-acetyltransferase [Pyrinomonadaceae bacterium]|mgnify:CR=1 FL=1|nr:GNAT family N-acetyltransferase [Pyrinomonadaceae bacterium]HMP65430.1 GNAT family N-acetyltransferase [Pyrinomonadaceae bacterium]
MIEIRQAESVEEIESARTLFREYEAWLGLDLCFQGFADELSGLPGKYSPPDGRLLIAYINEEPAGCIAMRKLEDGVVEMKRLYLRESALGHGAGLRLIQTLIDEARNEGYKKMRLDTFPPLMKKAVSLYRSHGFQRIEPYYFNPNPETLFLEKEL